jgi:alanyl-tRNA synthetase
VQQARDIADIAVITARVTAADAKVLREMAEMVRAKLQRPGVVVLASEQGERIALHVSIDPTLNKRGLHAGKFVGEIGARLGGKGGGRPDSAQGGGKDIAALPAALDLVPDLIRDNLR